MNISFVTSFTIGTLVLLSVLALNRNLLLHSAESTVEVMTEYKHDELFDMITHDLSRLGYGFPAGGERVEIDQLDDEKIVFSADVLENGVQTITWEFLGTDADNTENPHDKILVRTGTMGTGTPSNLQTTYSVIDFELTYYRDTIGETETSIPGQVRSILVEVTYESELPSNMTTAGEDEYQRKYWRKLIVPKNLQYE
jgi:hypothetical protein